MSLCRQLCLRLSRKRPAVLIAMTLTVVLVYFVLLSYLAWSRAPPNGPAPMASYILGINGQSLYDLDYVDVMARQLSKGNFTCKERTNFVFIKGMKCATSTLLGIFYRFGYTRNLSFVSPVQKKMYLNWPFPMTILDFRPSSRGYNILTDHSIYTEDVMKAIMPKDTVYLGILREPVAQVKSMFRYFQLAKIAGVPADSPNPFVEYFSQLDKYEAAYKAHNAKQRWCIPPAFSMTKNLMSHCHGMPLGFPPGTKDISDDTAAIDNYIKYLDERFGLIMIVEYFYESLILLRRLMCWKFKDIVFINSNVASYSYKEEPLPESISNLIRNRSNADFRLYHYFNQTLWKHISRQGTNFFSEVSTFKEVEAEVQTYCQEVYHLGKRSQYPPNVAERVIAETEWSQAFTFTARDCWMLGPNPYELLYVVQQENEDRETTLLAERAKISDNRTIDEKGMC